MVYHKKFGPAQKILGPVEGQGISREYKRDPSHCHFYSLMPCPFTGRKMFCAGLNLLCLNFLCRTKNLFIYCASHKHFVPDKNMICIQWNRFLCRQKSFWRGTKCSQSFWLTQNIWTGTKHFRTCKSFIWFMIKKNCMSPLVLNICNPLDLHQYTYSN